MRRAYENAQTKKRSRSQRGCASYILFSHLRRTMWRQVELNLRVVLEDEPECLIRRTRTPTFQARRGRGDGAGGATHLVPNHPVAARQRRLQVELRKLRRVVQDHRGDSVAEAQLAELLEVQRGSREVHEAVAECESTIERGIENYGAHRSPASSPR